MAEHPPTEPVPAPAPRPIEEPPGDKGGGPPGNAPARGGGGGRRRSRGRRALKWLIALLLLPLALAVLLVGGAWVLLHTGPGERLAGRIASKQVSDLLQGRLRVGKVELHGAFRVCLRQVALDDPETGPVLTADSACVGIAALALPKKHVAITDLELVHPVLDMASVTGKDGVKTNTLSRALAAKHITPKTPGGPLQWVIELHDLSLQRGALRIRPAPGAAPSLALDSLELSHAEARYAEDGALAKLALAAQLVAPGKLPARLELAAALDGSTDAGKLKLAKLHLLAGQSGLSATGELDLGTRKGTLQIAELRLRPEDVQALTPGKPPLIAGEVTGKGEVKTDGKSATARLSLHAASGRIDLLATATMQAQPEWSVKLQLLGVNPAALSPKAPAGEVTVKLDARGKGIPSYDEEGPLGQLEGKLHIGPARLRGMGAVAMDLDARLHGRRGLVRAFTASGLGLRLAAHGDAARDAVDLAVELDAPDLTAVAGAIAALTKKPAPALSGSAQLIARVKGRPLRPDAEVHLRAPRLVMSDVLDVADLTIDGEVHGDLVHPDTVPPAGNLIVAARNALIGTVELGAPSMRTELRWPAARLNLTAEVLGGQMQLRGQAGVDDDRDGINAPELTLSYPGNELKLRQPIAIHFRPDATVVEPFWLEGQHGGVGIAGTFYKPPAKGKSRTVDALIDLQKFDLAHLPQFVLPPDLNLHGEVSGRIAVDGRLPYPAIDAHVDLKGGGLRKVQGVDLKLFAHLLRDRLKAEAEGSGPAGVHLQLKAEAPLGNPKLLPAKAGLHGEIVLRDLDLAQAAQIWGNERVLKMNPRGVLGFKAAFEGTLAAPRVVSSVALDHFWLTLPRKETAQAAQATQAAAQKAGNTLGGAILGQKMQIGPPKAQPQAPARAEELGLRLGLLLEKGQAQLDSLVSLDGKDPVKLVARAPLDLLKLLREPAYLGEAMRRRLSAEVAVTDLDLGRLADLGLLPPKTAGRITSGKLRLDGTPIEPLLSVTATADGLAAGTVHGLGGALRLEVADAIDLHLTATAGADVLANFDLKLGVSAKEWAELRKIADPKALALRIADRPLSGELDIPGVYVGRVANLAGKEHAPANGRLVGSVKLEGTPGAPRIIGKLELREVVTRTQRLGHGDVYVEGGPDGATLHVGFSPPGGGTLLAHADLKADLTAKSILQSGMVGILQGQLDGRLTAKQFDLSLLSGITPMLRRAAGRLDGDVEVSGLLGHIVSKGKASLRGGLFDVVGQGVFHNVAFDASFSPKEIVLDRLTGQLGPGTFAAIVVADRRPAPATDDGSERVEFTGELHLGDDESVRDLKDEEGKPLSKAPLPIRQAGERRAEVNGEVDLFGSYDAGLLAVTAKIPEAGVHILSLPSKKLPSLKPNPDVLLVHAGEAPHPPGMEPEEVEEEKRARATATFRLQATLELEHLYVKAEDFEFPVRSNLNFEYDARRPEKPTADGTITVPNGSFTALGRRFQIEHAVITETGGEISDPELEIKARYEKAATTVFINVNGSASDPLIDLTSNPPMDQDAIAFFLATGRIQGRATQNGGGVDLSSAASSVVGGYVFGEVRKQLADVLPVDVLTVETSGAALTGASVGKYIGDSIFIGYRQRTTPAPDENTSEGKIEYEVSRSVTAEATVGDRQSDVSILWSKDF